MILKSLNLHNFRGYKDIEIEFDENFSVLIGKNDVGKSTIFEALEIFFNSEQIKLDSDDLFSEHEENDYEIRISCRFFVEDDEIIIDKQVKTNLSDEYLYNQDGLLEIVLVSDNGKKGKYYIKAFYPEEFSTPLIQMKISDLKKELDKRKDRIPKYESINKTISSEIRKAIYGSLEAPIILVEKNIDLTKEDAKNIYQSIYRELPIFFLFKADRENKDGDAEVQNPLKAATRNVLKGIEELENVKRKIEEEVLQIGAETIEKMKELDPDIAQSLKTSVNTKSWDSIFSFQLIDDYGIPLNKRGSGVRRLLLMSYLRAEAERRAKANANTNIIYAIEEPETAQHPDYQRTLMESLLDLSDNPLHQIMITTHTPEIAKMASIDQIIFIKKIDRKPVIILEKEDKFLDIKKTLGVHADLDSKVVVCVEGENDVSFLNNILKILEFNNIIDFSKENISIIPMHGGTLKSWIQRDYLKDSNVKEIHLYDSDVKEYAKLVKKMNDENDGRRQGFITEHLEMENYIPRELVENEFNIDLSEYADKWDDSLDIPKLLTGKIGRRFGRDDAEREKRVKMILNGSVMKKCTYEMIESMGNVDEISKWLNAIKQAVL